MEQEGVSVGMADLRKMVGFMDEELRTAQLKDYPGAMNGLQLENSGKIERIFTAVDASLAVVEEAAKQKGSLLIVHHGMFWQGTQAITGAYFQKIKAALDGDLAIYSTHLPLDVHPVFGNNVLLAKKIGLENIHPVFEKNGFAMGMAGKWGRGMDELVRAVEHAVGMDVIICPARRKSIETVLVITGAAGSQIREVAEAGFDAFVTGEGPHWSYIEAEERGIGVVYAGHYATETFGVRQLGERMAMEFSLESTFIERIGGL